MTTEMKVFGVQVEDVSDEVLQQMNKEAGAKEMGTFVVDETSRMISPATNDEIPYIKVLEIPTHTGSDILRHIRPEIDRRLKGRRVIAELLRKIGKGNDADAIEAAWQKVEASRRTTGPREVPARNALRLA